MSRMSLPLRSLMLPLTISVMFASSTSQASGRSVDLNHLARLTDRHVRIQQQFENRQLRLDARGTDRPNTVHAARHDALILSRQLLHSQNTQTLGINPFAALHNRSEFLSDAGRLRNVSGGAELDLTSDSRSIKLGSNLFDGNTGSLTITVGGETKTLTAGTFVTPAEYVALTQKLASGSQDLVVGKSGNALDGQVMLDVLSDAGRKIEATSLVIPASVNAIGDFGRHGDFKLTGELKNFGSVFALSTKDDVSVARIGARSIYNAEGALISTDAPSTLTKQFGHLNQALSLELNASESFVNLGHISSSKDLTISANEILNGGGNISAKGNVTLNSASVDNYGTISSANGNVNFTTVTPSAMNVYNDGGSIEARNGSINIRNSGFAEKFDTTLSGGDWLSKELNIQGGEGTVDVHAGTVTGAVVAHAGAAFINAATPNLYIKDLVTTGDPIVTNVGDITQGSISTNGAPLTIIAGGNINTTFGAVISTSNGIAAGGNILMVAGAAFEDATTPTHIGQTWITGGNSTGGDINASGTLITANGNTTGGNITLVAFPGTAFNGGNISASGIEAKGGTGSANGDVKIIGRQTSIFSVDTNGTGSTAGTGNVLISSWNAQITGGTEVRVIDDGSILAGTVVSGSFIPLTTTTADPNPGDSVIDSSNTGGTFTLESIDDAVVFGTINANLVNITGSESVDLEPGSSVNALTNVNIRAFGIDDAVGSGIDPSFINNVSTTNGNITIIQDRGTLNLRAGANIQANEGNILIQSANLGGKKAKRFDFLNISDNVTIFANASTAGLGNVTLATGVVPVIPVVGKPYKNVAVSEPPGGMIFWGKKKPSLSKLDNISVTAKGANVIISNLLGKRNFTIGTGVNITADPPAR